MYPNMHTEQVTNITVDEFIDLVRQALPQQATVPAAGIAPGLINIMNKREASRTLNISETLFDKLHQRGLIPCTVNVGTGRTGKPVKRWAEHHLVMIKPIIHGVRGKQNDTYFESARQEIRRLLGI